MLAELARIDVLDSQVLLWGVTSAISYGCIIQVAYLITGSNRTKVITSFLFSACLCWITPVRSDALVFIFPPPDRYGFSMGCLLPLALFHFLVHIRDTSNNLGMVVGLIYLIVEMSFVHARESIFVLFMVTVFLYLSATHISYKSQETRRCFWVVCFCIAVLFVYKTIALSLNPNLAHYVSQMSQENANELMTKSIALAHPVLFFEDTVDFFSEIIASLSNSPIALAIFFLTLISLSFHLTWGTRCIISAFLPGCFLLIATLATTKLSRALLGWIVGSNHLFNHASAYLILLSTIIYCDFLNRIYTLFKSQSRSSIRIFLFVLSQVIIGLLIPHSPSAAFFLFPFLLYTSIGIYIIILWKRYQTIRSHGLSSETYHFEWNTPQRGPQKTPYYRNAFFIFLTFTFSTIFITWILNKTPETAHAFLSSSRHDTFTRITKYRNICYAISSESGKCDDCSTKLTLPHEMYEFLIREIPQGTTVLSDDTSLLAIYCNLSTPLITQENTLFGDFVANTLFQEKYLKKDNFSIQDFLLPRKRNLSDFINNNHIKYIIVTPLESKNLHYDPARFSLVQSIDGFLTFKVKG